MPLQINDRYPCSLNSPRHRTTIASYARHTLALLSGFKACYYSIWCFLSLYRSVLRRISHAYQQRISHTILALKRRHVIQHTGTCLFTATGSTSCRQSYLQRDRSPEQSIAEAIHTPITGLRLSSRAGRNIWFPDGGRKVALSRGSKLCRQVLEMWKASIAILG